MEIYILITHVFVALYFAKVIFPLKLNDKIKSTINSYLASTSYKSIKTEEVKKKIEEGTTLFLSSLDFDRNENEDIRQIPILLGYLEVVVFSVISFVLLNQPEGVMDLITVIGGWLAIKVIGDYRQWSDPILGRAIFYVFLLGTMINIIIGVTAGLSAIFTARFFI